jgi:hypothetical protein
VRECPYSHPILSAIHEWHRPEIPREEIGDRAPDAMSRATNRLLRHSGSRRSTADQREIDTPRTPSGIHRFHRKFYRPAERRARSRPVPSGVTSTGKNRSQLSRYCDTHDRPARVVPVWSTAPRTPVTGPDETSNAPPDLCIDRALTTICKDDASWWPLNGAQLRNRQEWTLPVIFRNSTMSLRLCLVFTTLVLTFILSGPPGNARTNGAPDRSSANSAQHHELAGGEPPWNGTGSVVRGCSGV